MNNNTNAKVLADKINCRALPLATLLSDPSRQKLADFGPVLGSVPQHHLADNLVFFIGPGPFNEFRIQNLLPPVQTLHI